MQAEAYRRAGKLVAQLSIAVTPALKERLALEALRRRVLPSKLLREILFMGLTIYAEQDLPPQEEYEILLDDKDVKHLRRLGYELELCELEQEAHDGPTPSLIVPLARAHK